MSLKKWRSLSGLVVGGRRKCFGFEIIFWAIKIKFSRKKNEKRVKSSTKLKQNEKKLEQKFCSSVNRKKSFFLEGEKEE